MPIEPDQVDPLEITRRGAVVLLAHPDPEIRFLGEVLRDRPPPAQLLQDLGLESRRGFSERLKLQLERRDHWLRRAAEMSADLPIGERARVLSANMRSCDQRCCARDRSKPQNPPFNCGPGRGRKQQTKGRIHIG